MERCRNPQASTYSCKRICKRDAAEPAEAGGTNKTPGDLRPAFAELGSHAGDLPGQRRRASSGS